MINWHQLQPLYERKAYRIVQKHIKLILSKIPVDNTNLYNYETVIALNIHEQDVKKMFVDIYTTIGISYGNKVNNELEKTKKANILFNEYLLRQILLFLSTDGGVKITSVRDTLVGDVIKSIKDTIGENATVIDLQNAIHALISKSQTFYKWQALRIARTETTSASNFAGMETAKASDLVLDKVWISVQDDRTRRTPYDHLSLDGVVQELDKPYYVGGSDYLQYPGDTKGQPADTINCRCTLAYIPRRDKDGLVILKTDL
jgi:hypothetical protein